MPRPLFPFGFGQLFLEEIHQIKKLHTFKVIIFLPGNIVLPPDRTVFAYKSLRMSMSDFMMELKVVSAIPGVSIPAKFTSARFMLIPVNSR